MTLPAPVRPSPPLLGLSLPPALPALIFYEYCITFEQEFILFWKRKPNSASILYFLNRYFYLVYTVFDAADYVTMSDRVSTSLKFVILVLS